MKTNQPIQPTRNFLKLIVLFSGVSLLIGCSAVKFSTKADCGNDSNCVIQAGDAVHPIDEVIAGGRVDILFVNDNSASMSYEQARLAQRLDQFVNQFDARQIQYRMAVTTTDISSAQNTPRSINQNGSLQDGKLITFTNGQKFLSHTSGTPAQKQQMFNTVINRPETLSCEQFIKNWPGSRDTLTYSQGYFNACPSTDERGIYAANLVITNNPDGFIRPEADLAIIFLADEDERSQMYWHNIPGFALEDNDRATSLISNIRSRYPQKTLGIHAIVVKDQNCLNQQNTQTNGLVSGSYGWEYYNATQATGGIAGDICASDYTQQLQAIADNVNSKIVVDKIALKCGAPNFELTNLTLSTNDPSITYQVVGSELRFSKKLPVGSTVKGSYKCKASAT